MAVANAATNQSFRKRFLKTGLVVLCSAFLGGTFAAEALRRKAKTNSLALNLMGLPTSHREMITTFENLENASLTPHTYVSSAESLLPHVRKLKPTLATHHVLRIQAANFLKKYHSALSQVLNEKDINNELELEEYLLHLRRRISDMNLAFDFVNFKQSEVSDSITNVVKFNKMDYARLGRDAQKIRTAFDEIYNRNKQNPGEQNTETSSIEKSKLDEEELKKQEEETRESLLEHELMALYTHAPYLGEWNTFIKIGDALKETYGHLEPLNTNGNDNGHDDGISFNDLYEIAKTQDLVTEIPTPMQSSLHFDIRPIESVKIKYNSYKSIGDEKENESNSGSGWFGGNTNKNMDKNIIPASKDWMELTNDNYNDHIIPMNICRLGGVQKSLSISKCVPRVQGPIYYDGKMKMRGSTTFMAPRDSKYDSNNKDSINILPQNVGLNGVNDFIEIKQTEEWNLKPMEEGQMNELEGTVKIRREPVNIDDKCDSFEIEYDCILKLGSQPEDYY